MKNTILFAGACLTLTGIVTAPGPARAAAPAPALSLAANGKSAYTIALAADAIPAEKTAARQLQGYLRQVTGATLAIRPEAEVSATAPQILVGPGRRAKALLPRQNWAALRSDGIVIKTVGNKLVLAGGRPRGSLYAVFQFLEDTVGCRWWTPAVKSIPGKAVLRIPAQNVTYVPPFSYREHYATASMEDPVFATVMRENGHHQKQNEEWGGHYNMLGFVHTYTALLPQEKYFKDHPEWYTDPLNDYKPCTPASPMPVGQNTQLCLSNPEVVEELTKQALAWIEKDPGAGYISISQNDSDAYCTCTECAGLAAREGSQAGPVLRFTNRVAERIGRKYPDFQVETLAYRGSVDPPKTVRPASNVLIRLAPIGADFGHALNSDWNKATRDNLLQWARIAPNLFVWNYVTNFNTTLMPHPNWDGLAKDLRFFAAHNVRGVFEQGNAYTNAVGDFAPLRQWVISKLMWNPQLDQARLTSEFLKGYYGPAAPQLQEYIDLYQSSFLKQNSTLSLSNRDFSFLGLNEMNTAKRLFDEAGALVKGTPYAERLRRERISLDLAWLIRYRPLKAAAEKTGQPFGGPADTGAALDAFLAAAKEFKVQFWGEHVLVENQRTILEGYLAPAVALPGFAANFPAEDVIDIQDRAFSLHGERMAGFTGDAAASDGEAAFSVGDKPDWAIQMELNQALSSVLPEKWHVYAMVRVALKPDAAGGAAPGGPGITAGIYDDTNRLHIANSSVPLEKLGTTEYKVVDLGSHLLNKYGYVWFASALNPAVDRVLVDRVILVRDRTP